MPQTGYFRGDADCMVDRLIEASTQAWAPKTGYTGYGRELQPWCADDDTSPAFEFQPLEAASMRNNNNVHANKHGRSPDAKKAGGSAAAKRARAAPAPAARRCSLEHGAAQQGTFACPSFAAAPKPEALPMPTSSLMTRALCRRSPSPPKMPAATAIMA